MRMRNGVPSAIRDRFVARHGLQTRTFARPAHAGTCRKNVVRQSVCLSGRHPNAAAFSMPVHRLPTPARGPVAARPTEDTHRTQKLGWFFLRPNPTNRSTEARIWSSLTLTYLTHTRASDRDKNRLPLSAATLWLNRTPGGNKMSKMHLPPKKTLFRRVFSRFQFNAVCTNFNFN